MPLINKKPKPEEHNSEDTTKPDKIGMKQWLKNSGHSMKGVFLEWLTEQPLFDIVNGEIKQVKQDIKKYNEKKNLSKEEKKSLKQKLAGLSDSAISKFCKEYMDDQAPEEVKENIRQGIGNILSSIKSGKFYQKAGSFGDDDLDAFLDGLDDDWDSSGESYLNIDLQKYIPAGEQITQEGYMRDYNGYGEFFSNKKSDLYSSHIKELEYEGTDYLLNEKVPGNIEKVLPELHKQLMDIDKTEVEAYYEQHMNHIEKDILPRNPDKFESKVGFKYSRKAYMNFVYKYLTKNITVEEEGSNYALVYYWNNVPEDLYEYFTHYTIEIKLPRTGSENYMIKDEDLTALGEFSLNNVKYGVQKTFGGLKIAEMSMPQKGDGDWWTTDKLYPAPIGKEKAQYGISFNKDMPDIEQSLLQEIGQRGLSFISKNTKVLKEGIKVLSNNTKGDTDGDGKPYKSDFYLDWYVTEYRIKKDNTTEEFHGWYVLDRNNDEHRYSILIDPKTNNVHIADYGAGYDFKPLSAYTAKGESFNNKIFDRLGLSPSFESFNHSYTEEVPVGENVTLDTLVGNLPFNIKSNNHDLSYNGDVVPFAEAFGYNHFDHVMTWLKKFKNNKSNRNLESYERVAYKGDFIDVNFIIENDKIKSIPDSKLNAIKYYRDNFNKIISQLKKDITRMEVVFNENNISIRYWDSNNEYTKEISVPGDRQYESTKGFFNKVKEISKHTLQRLKDEVKSTYASKEKSDTYLNRVKAYGTDNGDSYVISVANVIKSRTPVVEYITLNVTKNDEPTNEQKKALQWLLSPLSGNTSYTMMNRLKEIITIAQEEETFKKVENIELINIKENGNFIVYYTADDGINYSSEIDHKIVYKVQDTNYTMLFKNKFAKKAESLDVLLLEYTRNLSLAALAESSSEFKGPVEKLSAAIIDIKNRVTDIVARCENTEPHQINAVYDIKNRTDETMNKIETVAKVLDNSDKSLNDKYSSTLSNSILALMTANDNMYTKDMTETTSTELIDKDREIINRMDNINPTVGQQIKTEFNKIKDAIKDAEDDLVYQPIETEEAVAAGELFGIQGLTGDVIRDYVSTATLVTGSMAAIIAAIALPYNLYKNKKNAKLESEFGSALSVQQPLVATDDISNDVIGSYSKFIETNTAIEIKQALESSTAVNDGGNIVRRSKNVLGNTFTNMNKQSRRGGSIKEDQEEILSSFSQSFFPVNEVIRKVYSRNKEAFDLVYGIQSLVSSGENGVFVNDNNHSPKSTIEVEITYTDTKNMADLSLQVVSKKATVTVDISSRKLPYEDVLKTMLEMNERYFSTVKVTPQEKNTNKIIQNNIKVVKAKGTKEEKMVLTNNKFADIINKIEHVKTPLFHMLLSSNAYHDLKQRGMDVRDKNVYQKIMKRLPIISIGICDEDSEIITYSTGTYAKYRDIQFKQLENEISKYEKELQSMIKFGMQR